MLGCDQCRTDGEEAIGLNQAEGERIVGNVPDFRAKPCCCNPEEMDSRHLTQYADLEEAFVAGLGLPWGQSVLRVPPRVLLGTPSNRLSCPNGT